MLIPTACCDSPSRNLTNACSKLLTSLLHNVYYVTMPGLHGWYAHPVFYINTRVRAQMVARHTGQVSTRPAHGSQKTWPQLRAVSLRECQHTEHRVASAVCEGKGGRDESI